MGRHGELSCGLSVVRATLTAVTENLVKKLFGANLTKFWLGARAMGPILTWYVFAPGKSGTIDLALIHG